MRAKDAVRALLDRLPDNCSLEDVLNHVYVLQQVEEGLQSALEGRVIPHEQIIRELRLKYALGSR
jgi:predicted transcriptional regulator